MSGVCEASCYDSNVICKSRGQPQYCEQPYDMCMRRCRAAADPPPARPTGPPDHR